MSDIRYIILVPQKMKRKRKVLAVNTYGTFIAVVLVS